MQAHIRHEYKNMRKGSLPWLTDACRDAVLFFCMGQVPPREQRAAGREESLIELVRGRVKTAGPKKTMAMQ